MRIVTLCLALLLTTGCVVDAPLYCDPDHPCTMIERPYCDLTGEWPQSEGHGRTCIAYPWDAAVPISDAAMAQVDAAVPVCGNGMIEGDEICDVTALGGHDCTTIGMGFVGGTLACNADCMGYNVSGCTAPSGCGDGMVGGMEQCDGVNLAGATCMTHGFMGGALGCTGGCVFDTSGCYTCGNATVEGPEMCDGANLAGATCLSRGHDGAEPVNENETVGRRIYCSASSLVAGAIASA